MESLKPLSLDPSREPGLKNLADEPKEINNYLFWKHFSLRSKAMGFAEFLTRQSQVACHVKKQNPDHYRIYFSYQGKGDLKAKINRIEATGIRL